MSIPEIIFIALYAIQLLLLANKHGQERTGKYNFWSGLLSVFISINLLYWAGLFHFSK
jgi:hypothetical protein